MPLRPLNRDSGLPEPYPTAHAPQIAVMLRHLADLLDDAARHQPEVSRIEGQADIREASHQPVENKVAKAQEQGFLAKNALRVDNVVPLLVSSDELGYDFRNVLQVAVHHDGSISRDVIECRGERCLMAKIARKRDGQDSRVLACRFFEDRECAVGAAVIHEYNFVGAARHVVQDSPRPAQEVRKNRFFIVNRDGNGASESWIHGIARLFDGVPPAGFYPLARMGTTGAGYNRRE